MAESACPNCGAPVKNLIDTRGRRCYAFVDETAGLCAQLAEAQEQHQAELSRVAMAHESEKRELKRRLDEAAELALRLSCEVGRLTKALAEAPRVVELAAIRAFVARVNARAEQDILAGRPITGAHDRALQVELAALEQQR